MSLQFWHPFYYKWPMNNAGDIPPCPGAVSAPVTNPEVI